MNMLLQAVLIFAGLSLDSFIVMMQKGAQLKNLSFKKMIGYTAEFAFVTACMFTLGYLSSTIFTPIIKDPKLEIMISALIVFFIGVFQLTKSFMKTHFVEKLDADFNAKKLFKQALYTSIDVFFAGAAYGFYGIYVGVASLIAFIITFIAVLIALLVGYHYGASYQRAAGAIGGILMVFFSIYMITVYVVLG